MSYISIIIIGIVVIVLTIGSIITLEKRAVFDELVSKLVKVLGAVAVIMTLAAVILESMPEEKTVENSGTTEQSENLDSATADTEKIIKIGVLEEPPEVINPWMYEGNMTAIEAAFENRPTVMMEGVEYQVELIYNHDLPSYSAEPFDATIHYQETAEYFEKNECFAVIALYHTESAIKPVVELGIPVLTTYYEYDDRDIVFTLDQTEENFVELQAQFILNQIPEAVNSNKMIVLYDEKQSDPIIRLEKKDCFISTFEACGGEVVYSSVSNQEQIKTALETAIAADEYYMIYAGLLYGDVMPEDVLIVRDKLNEEIGGGTIVPVIVDRNDQQMLNQYDNTYNLMSTFNSDTSSSIREKTGDSGVSETCVQLYSAYDIILDTLEVLKANEELATIVKTGKFVEVGAHGNVTFDGGTQAIYDSISAMHQSYAGGEPEYMEYTVE